MISKVKQLFKSRATTYAPSSRENQQLNNRGNMLQNSMNADERCAVLQPLLVTTNKNAAVVARSPWTAILPPEIILFHIIDNELHDDIPTLQNLALTCRFIHPYVQNYLFQSINVRPTIQPNMMPNIIRFLSTLHRRPDILPHIRSLTITVMTVVKVNSRDIHARHETNCLFFILIQAFPNLESFRLVFDASFRAAVVTFPWSEFKNAIARLMRSSPKLARVTFQPAGYIASTLLFDSILDVNQNVNGEGPIYSDLTRDAGRGQVVVFRL